MLRNLGKGSWLLQCKNHKSCSEQVVLDDKVRTREQARQEARRLGYSLNYNEETCPQCTQREIKEALQMNYP